LQQLKHSKAYNFQKNVCLAKADCVQFLTQLYFVPVRGTKYCY